MINNCQEEYAEVFAIMQHLKEAPVENKFQFQNHIEIFLFRDNEVKKYNHISFNSILEKCIIENKYIIKDERSLPYEVYDPQYNKSFCIIVNNTDEGDCTNFHYFELIRSYEKNCYLIIIPKDVSDYFRISDFYQLESRRDNEGYNRRFCIGESGRTQRLALYGNNTPKYFLPLFKINKEMYNCLSKSVCEFLKETDINSGIISFTSVINNYFSKLLKCIREKYNIMSSIDITKHYSHITVLGYCYFLSYLYSVANSDNANEIKEYQVNSLILQSEDFAVGTLQLLENAIKHANNGFFCFRIYKHETYKKYLNLNYSISNESPMYKYFIEIHVSDFNTSYDIPKKFIDNLNKRYLCKCKDLISEFNDGVTLKDFFDPSEENKLKWDKYYSDKANLALHYGLNIFEQIIISSSGHFIVYSSNKCKLDKHNIYEGNFTSPCISCDDYHIPGTQYKILLPIKQISTYQSATGLNIRLDITKLKNNYIQHTIVFGEKELEEKYDYKVDYLNIKDLATKCVTKEDFILCIKSEIRKIIGNVDKNEIIVFDVKNLASSLTGEIFAKNLICLLGDNDSKLDKVAIIHASNSFFPSFIRTFGLLYYKRITRDFLSDTSIYICGNFAENSHHREMYFKGKSIRQSIAVSKTISDYKGEFPEELIILENIYTKSEPENKKTKNISIIPFDVLVKDKSQTLFQKKTISDLLNDLQKYSFGCKLLDVHMMVGSKIHVTEYFSEAVLLFAIENYVSRFAFLLARNIYIKTKNINKKIVLVGYETYSEMLIIETQRMLMDLYSFDCDYLIYEDVFKNIKFREAELLNNYDINSVGFVIIVPVGSTLTTHDKILADLRRSLSNISPTIFANLCVVLIRDKSNNKLTTTEKLFWKEINESTVTLKNEYNLGDDNEVQYIISINNKWENPEFCKSCFPDKLTEERPILKINKASVIPMIMMGIKENNDIIDNKSVPFQFTDISVLKDCIQYGHFVRGDNHFEYYVKTESLIKKIIKDQKNLFEKWAKGVYKEIFSKRNDNYLYFDIVVTSQHKTNAEFVTLVNDLIFNKPNGIIFLDIKREYRDNVKTKFSNLTQLYINLLLSGRKAVINFHYVDDTITTGETFVRAKSLIRSLFPSYALSENGYENITINIFSSVIILVGRCSEDTKLNYVQYGRFFSYINLNISNLRNHHDACTMCKKYNEYSEMCKLSATNSLAVKFKKRSEKYSITTQYIISDKDQCSNYMRMSITHQLNCKLQILGNGKNCNEKVKDVLIGYINELINTSEGNIDQITKKFCAFIHVISSPFAVYRKSVLEVSFQLLLNIVDYLLFNNSRVENEYLSKEIRQYILDVEDVEKNDILNLFCFIKYVFFRISYMGANYVMRKNVILGFFNYLEKYKSVNEISNYDWVNFYCTVLKQTLFLNKQDGRVLYLEKIITDRVRFANVSSNVLKKFEDLRKIVILENNLILSDTLNEAVSALQNEIVKNKKMIFSQINREHIDCHDHQKKYSPEEIEMFSSISEQTSTDLVLELLFDPECRVRNFSCLKDSLTNVINAYFCEGFRVLLIGENATVDKKPEIINMLLDMALLSLLLIPNRNLSGKRSEHLKFYNVLVNQIRSVIKVDKVQLFICRDGDIDYICSSDNSLKSDKKYEGFVKEIQYNNFPMVGDTYFYKDCLNVIKIAYTPDSSRQGELGSGRNAGIIAWHLVYETRDENEIDRLKNVRNLLVMREALLMRFKKDYGNNLYEEFSLLRKKVIKLTDDKAGGHTPFSELSQDFDYMFLQSKNEQNYKFEKKQIANSMKLISDLLIGKLYVCYINDESYPEAIENRKCEIRSNLLKEYEKLIMISSYLVLRKSNSLEIVPDISFEEVDWNLSFDFMAKSEFIWVSFFYALIINALRHGRTEKDRNTSYEKHVKVNVKTTDNYLIIENNCVDQRDLDKRKGITLETIKAFFSHYDFWLESSCYSGKFIVKIPLKRKELKD